MATVGQAIQDEIKRNYELLHNYRIKGDGPANMAAGMIRSDLDYAHEALKEDNVVKILQAYEKLKENK